MVVGLRIDKIIESIDGISNVLEDSMADLSCHKEFCRCSGVWIVQREAGNSR